MVRQLLYVSSRTPGKELDVDAILATSRRNNAAANITGLLYTDASRFLQLLEGDAATVAATFARIKADPRHRAVVVLSDREVPAREFGDWSMAHRAAGGSQDAFDERLERLLSGASAQVVGTFMGLVSARRSA